MPSAKGLLARIYRPFDNPTLYLRFAGTLPTETGIIEFANQYGTLGAEVGRPIPVKPADSEQQIVVTGEPIEAWWVEIHELRQVLRLWHLIQVGDVAGLSGHIKWKSGDVVGCYYESHPDSGDYDVNLNPWKMSWIASSNKDPELLPEFQAAM